MGNSIEATERHPGARERHANNTKLRGDASGGCPQNPAIEPCNSIDNLPILNERRDRTLVAGTLNKVKKRDEEKLNGINGRHFRNQGEESLCPSMWEEPGCVHQTVVKTTGGTLKYLCPWLNVVLKPSVAQ